MKYGTLYNSLNSLKPYSLTSQLIAHPFTFPHLIVTIKISSNWKSSMIPNLPPQSKAKILYLTLVSFQHGCK